MEGGVMGMVGMEGEGIRIVGGIRIEEVGGVEGGGMEAGVGIKG